MNDSFSGREENDRSNYFMINLHESMGLGRDRTRDHWRLLNRGPFMSAHVLLNSLISGVKTL